jgi:hypothetical protein
MYLFQGPGEYWKSLLRILKSYLLTDPCFDRLENFDWSKWVAISLKLNLESQL